MQDLEVRHVANFVSAVRSRNAKELNAEAWEGHLSASCCHMANVSYRLGRWSPPDAVLETVGADRELSDAFRRCREYLQSHGVDLVNSQATLGPWVTLDANQWRFIDEFADQANELSRRSYREPFVVPQLA